MVSLPQEMRLKIDRPKTFFKKLQELQNLESKIKNKLLHALLRKKQREHLQKIREHQIKIQKFIAKNYKKICEERSTLMLLTDPKTLIEIQKKDQLKKNIFKKTDKVEERLNRSLQSLRKRRVEQNKRHSVISRVIQNKVVAFQDHLPFSELVHTIAESVDGYPIQPQIDLFFGQEEFIEEFSKYGEIVRNKFIKILK